MITIRNCFSNPGTGTGAGFGEFYTAVDRVISNEEEKCPKYGEGIVMVRWNPILIKS